jgi:hypothetical protein
MKKRYIYSLLFGIPGLGISLVLSFLVFWVMVGFLWIYVFGDDSWPASTQNILPLLFFLTFLLLWIVSIAAGYRTGKKLEFDPVLNKKHMAVSFISTIVPLCLILFHQLQTGHIGPPSDSELCSDFCVQNGFSVSGMAPRNSGERKCICFDESGQETISASIESILLD